LVSEVFREFQLQQVVLPMSNLIDIQSQIQKLQKQASEIKAREFNKTVQEILAKMNAFGITAKDLQPVKARSGKGKAAAAGAGKAAPGRAKKKEKSANPVAAKFRGPNGETWSGRGLTPRWLTALVAEGKSKDEFAVKN
jgi:DNA-binding protein H-NS